MDFYLTDVVICWKAVKATLFCTLYQMLLCQMRHAHQSSCVWLCSGAWNSNVYQVFYVWVILHAVFNLKVLLSKLFWDALLKPFAQQNFVFFLLKRDDFEIALTINGYANRYKQLGGLYIRFSSLWPYFCIHEKDGLLRCCAQLHHGRCYKKINGFETLFIVPNRSLAT